MLWDINLGYYNNWFNRFPITTLHNSLAKDGDIYFRAKSTAYVPVLSKAHFSNPLNMGSILYDSNQVEPNKYITKGENQSWGSNYLSNRTNFLDRVLNPVDTLFAFNYNNVSQYETSSLQRMSYSRIKRGISQLVDDTYLFSFAGLHLCYREKEGEEVKPLMGVYFKTEHVKDLQSAILTGKPMKASWFTVFIAETFPALVLDKKGNFKKAFYDATLGPFEQKGFPIVVQDDFIASLGSTTLYQELKEQSKAYIEVPFPNNRAEAAEYKENLFQQYLNQEFEIYNAEYRLKESILAEEVLEAALKSRVAALCVNKLRTIIDEDFYKGVLPENDTVRELIVGDKSITEKVTDGLWVEHEIAGLLPIDSIITFSIFSDTHSDNLTYNDYSKLNSESVQVYCDRISVAEGDFVCNANLDLYMLNSKYHLIKIFYLHGSSFTYSMDSSLYRYLGVSKLYHRITRSELPRIKYFPVLEQFQIRQLLIATLEDVLDHKISLETETAIYLLDNHKYYYLKNGVLALYEGADYDLVHYLSGCQVTLFKEEYKSGWETAQNLFDYAFDVNAECLLSNEKVLNTYKKTLKLTTAENVEILNES